MKAETVQKIFVSTGIAVMFGFMLAGLIFDWKWALPSALAVGLLGSVEEKLYERFRTHTKV